MIHVNSFDIFIENIVHINMIIVLDFLWASYIFRALERNQLSSSIDFLFNLACKAI